MSLVFDLATEQARYLARQPLLERAWALRLELAPGIIFQPETEESVEDQVVETLWSEGNTLESISKLEEMEVRSSFAVLTPRRESGGWSIAASLFLGFSSTEREQKMDRLRGLPGQLRLALESGAMVEPEVDRGAAGPNDRLPAVLALRYFVPDRIRILALVSNHPEVSGHWEAPGAWLTWAA
ncbi:MAG: hypothetical protein IPP78_15885 [Holophagaceae bacterium]|nr:hypothetical protein [Holophagaceae bacterium]